MHAYMDIYVYVWLPLFYTLVNNTQGSQCCPVFINTSYIFVFDCNDTNEYKRVPICCFNLHFLIQSSSFLKRMCFILFWRNIHISEIETHNLYTATCDWHLYCHCIYVMKLRCARCIHSLYIGK